MMKGSIVKTNLIKKQDLVKYVSDKKDEIQEILKEQRVHYSQPITNFLRNEISEEMSLSEMVDVFKKSCDIEINISLIDLGFENHIIIIDYYDLLNDLVVDSLDTHEFDVNLDYQPIISKHKLKIDGNLIEAKKLYNEILNSGSKFPVKKLELYNTKAYNNFIDKDIVESMIVNLIKYDKRM